MAFTSVELAILGLCDRWAYQKQAAVTATTGGTDVWSRVDAAANEVFENRVKGSSCTDLDTAFEAMTFGQWTTMATVLSNLAAYCVTDLALASFDAWLTARFLRIDSRMRDLFVERYGAASVSLTNVHGQSDGGAACPGQILGNLTQGGALAAGTDLVLTSVSPSPVLARVTVKGATDWTLSVTAKLWDDTTKVIAQVVEGTGDGGLVGDTYVIGKQAIGATANAAQKEVLMAATGQFKIGQTVLLTEWSGSPPAEVWSQQEVGIIAGITADTKLTLTTNLLHTYSTSGFVYPCYKGVSAASGSGGNASDRVYFFPAPDRRLAL